MRHGERDGGKLIDLGRDITADKARTSGSIPTDFDAVKAIGSDAGDQEDKALVTEGGAMEWNEEEKKWQWNPALDRAMGRSLETPHIYAQHVPGGSQHTTRVRDQLNYTSVKTPPPYDHLKIYNEHLPENFGDLVGQERIAAAKKAQDAVMDHVSSLDTPEARLWKQETAGGFAVLIQRYANMATRLNSGSRVLIPAGTHGGTMEWILKEALRWDGHNESGFTHIHEIGGGFNPSESYSVRISTNEKGELQDFTVEFDDPSRPPITGAKLDKEKVRELAQLYTAIHTAE